MSSPGIRDKEDLKRLYNDMKKHKYMDHACPDFGFSDALSFDLHNQEPESKDGQYSIWHYMYNYVSDKPKFERFNNIVQSK